MEAVVSTQFLAAVAHRTLHAHSFTRSSAQATVVLTDLLSKYLLLLAATCSNYANHSGRTVFTARDALAALEELGVTLEELHGFASGEGKELARYATKTARRMDELAELRGQ